MEKVYQASLIKAFKKQVDDGYFPFILVDSINDKTEHYQPMWSYAKQKGFEVRNVGRVL
jgi:YLP motif-containing protein 1